MRISSPPTKFSCYYGIDTPLKEELIANSLEIDEIRKYITSDTLGYLSLEGVMKGVEETKHLENGESFCSACFSGKYPVELTDLKKSKHKQLGLFNG
jgi:amidophosphoribosyltransferase